MSGPDFARSGDASLAQFPARIGLRRARDGHPGALHGLFRSGRLYLCVYVVCLGSPLAPNLLSCRLLHILKLIDLDRTLGEAGGDFELSTHGLDKALQGADVHIGAALEL